MVREPFHCARRWRGIRDQRQPVVLEVERGLKPVVGEGVVGEDLLETLLRFLLVAELLLGARDPVLGALPVLTLWEFGREALEQGVGFLPIFLEHGFHARVEELQVRAYCLYSGGRGRFRAKAGQARELLELFVGNFFRDSLAKRMGGGQRLNQLCHEGLEERILGGLEPLVEGRGLRLELRPGLPGGPPQATLKALQAFVSLALQPEVAFVLVEQVFHSVGVGRGRKVAQKLLPVRGTLGEVLLFALSSGQLEKRVLAQLPAGEPIELGNRAVEVLFREEIPGRFKIFGRPEKALLKTRRRGAEKVF